MNKTQEIFDSRLDNIALSDLYDGDMEQALIIFEQFIDTSPGLMQELAERFREGDIEDFRKRVHKIKPVFSYVGLTDLTHIAETIERKCNEISDISEVSQLYDQLKNQYSEGFSIVGNELKRLSDQSF